MKCKAIKGFLARQWYNENYYRGRLTCHLWKGYIKVERNLETQHNSAGTKCCPPKLQWWFGGSHHQLEWVGRRATQKGECHVQESPGSGKASRGTPEETCQQRKGCRICNGGSGASCGASSKERWEVIIMFHLRPNLAPRNICIVPLLLTILAVIISEF